MWIPVLLFAFGLLLLIRGGDWFVDGATGIAHRFHLPEILIGATIVSIGTTLPEVMVSATSAVSGHSEIAYGNAIGSVICNTALIAALTLAIRPGNVQKKSLYLPVAAFFSAAVIYAVVAYFVGTFSRIVGVLLLLLFVGYMILSTVMMKKDPDIGDSSEPTESPEENGKRPLFRRDLILLIVGAAAIAWGANLLVENGTKIAEAMGVPESVIALTFVALGTSLPELITAITSLIKGHSSLSLGNIIGANLFNLVLVSGTAVTLRPFPLPAGTTLFGYNASLIVDLPLMFAVMLILTIPPLCKGKLYRWQGITLLCLYAGFCVFQFS